jgi:tetrahydromethanopterin S-methyltransferase subunit H
LLPSFGNVFIYAKFKINQEEIAKTICIQRKLVLNTCNGRCELQKSIKNFEDNEKNSQNNLKERLDLIYIQNLLENNFTLVPPIEKAKSVFSCFTEKPISVCTTTFRPPSYFI